MATSTRDGPPRPPVKPEPIPEAEASEHVHEIRTILRRPLSLQGLRNRGTEDPAFTSAASPNARTLLDVACGTGKHLECLRNYYEVEGLDINSELLAKEQQRCPGVFFHLGSMTDFSIDTRFDVITCLFSSIAYEKTAEKLELTISNMTRHLNPGGVLLIEPYFTPEDYWINRVTANVVNQSELKIAWMYTSGVPIENVAEVLIHYIVGTPAKVDYFTELHELGLFTNEQWVTAFSRAGLDCIDGRQGFFGRGLYIGRP